MPHRICWKQESVDRILQTEALAGDDSVFLATHFPIEGFETGGNRAAEISSATEQGLFDALSRDTVRHAFCVVRGEPGSGKSHLIRWLSIQWKRRESTDLVLLIQRADGSLDNTLEQLKQALPVESDASLWRGIVAGSGISFEGRVKLFHDALGHSLEAGFLEEEKDDLSWCEQRGLASLLLAEEVRESWSAPSRILHIVSGRGGERNSELAQFQLSDVRELARLGERIENRKRTHIRFLQVLTDELQAVDDITNKGKQLREVAPEVANLLRALNERLNPAIQHFLGISPHGLKELFRRVRRKLRHEGRRLVLLLEDITNFQGVDNLLIDVLVTDSQTRPDECDLVSIVGLTPDYYEKFIGGLGNIVARLTHVIRLGRVEHGFETITSLESSEAQVRFTARYLNAVRLGTDRLRDGSHVPNVCETCPDQESCTKSFGSRDGHGLYPLTETYITENFKRLTDPEGRLTHKTPRGLLQNLVHPALFHVEDLERGSYPPPEFPIAPIRGATDLAGPVLDRLRATVRDDEANLARLRLLVGLWGNHSSSASATRNSDGELEFAGIPKSIFEIFQAPWPGGDTVADISPNPTSVPVIVPSLGRLAVAPASPTDEPIESDRKPPQPGSAQKAKTSSVPRQIRPGHLGARINQLSAWESGGRLQDPSFWNQEVYRCVAEIPWEQLGIPYYLWRRLITIESVLLETTGQARSTHLVVPRVEWVYRGLHGFLCLRSPSGDEDIELMLRYAARFRRKLQQLVLGHVRKRTSVFTTRGGEPWDPVHTTVQMLAARAWLRGDTSPLVEPAEQWRILLSDEPEASSAPKQRVDSWAEFLADTGYMHAKFREILHQFIPLPQSSELRVDLVDAACGFRALRELRENVAYTGLLAAPMNSPGPQFSELATLSQKAFETETKLAGLPNREATRLRERAGGLLEALRGNSVAEHIARVDRAITAVLQYLPDAAPQSATEWKQQVAKLQTAGYSSESPEVRKVEDFLSMLDDAPAESATLLQWCLDAPVQAFYLIKTACDAGEVAIVRITDHVTAYVGRHDSRGTVAIEDVQAIGTRLAGAAAGIEARAHER